LRLNAAVMLMHRPGTFLMKMHDKDGTAFFVVPGGRLRNDDAEKIIARTDIVPDNNGLFPGVDQSWRMMSRNDGDTP
jgi:hypothetical protein